MKPNLVIAKPAELVLKSRYVMKTFESHLNQNIRINLEKNNIAFSKIEKKRQRFVIHTDQAEKAIKSLKKVFGISLLHLAVQTNQELDSIKKIALEQAKEQGLDSKKSFAMRSKRTNKKFPLTSKELNIQVGDFVNEETKAKVNLTKPDVEIFVEVVEDTAFIFTKKIRGLGGLPVGVSGKLVCLISDDNSFTAAKQMMKRGVRITCLNFGNSDEATEIVAKLQEYSPVNIDFIIEEEVDKHNMFVEAEKLAKKIKAKGIVTGSTKLNMKPQEGIGLPIYSPLIGQ